MGWAVAAGTQVCGKSTIQGRLGTTDACVVSVRDEMSLCNSPRPHFLLLKIISSCLQRESSAAAASTICMELGGRLCAVDEVVQHTASPSDCSYDSIWTWSWVENSAELCPGNQAAAVAGSFAGWFELSPLRLGLHEIQIHTHASVARTFQFNSDIRQANGDLVPLSKPPALYTKSDTLMLRWNISRAELTSSPHYLYVTSSNVDAEYSVSLAVPPTYSWRKGTSVLMRDQASWRRLHMPTGTDAPEQVDLGMDFEFYGRKFSQVFVSSAGYIAFQRPQDNSAVMGEVPCIIPIAGELDLNRDGSMISLSQTPDEFSVRFYAPLYNSSMFSDVTATLHRNGSIAIDWVSTRIEDTTSLKHREICWLSFDRLSGYQIPDSSSGQMHAGIVSSVKARPTLVDPSNYEVETINICSPPASIPSQGFVTPVGSNITDSYGDGLDCRLVITAPSRFRIRVVIERLATEGMYDFLQIFDGGDISSPQLMLEGTGQVDWTPMTQTLTRSCCLPAWYQQNGQYIKPNGPCQGVSATSSGVLGCGHDRNNENHDSEQFCGFSGNRVERDADTLITDTNEVTLRFNSDCDTNRPLGFLLSYELFCPVGVDCDQPDSDRPAADGALALSGDEYVTIPNPVTFGAHVAVSAWIRLPLLRLDLGTNSGDFTLLSSYESLDCGSSAGCKNAVHGIEDRDGWVAIGNAASSGRPADITVLGTAFDSPTSVWDTAVTEWVQLTVVISGLQVAVHAHGDLQCVGTRSVPVPLITRSATYIGGSPNTPFDNRGAGWLAINDFKLWNRKLSAGEVSALATGQLLGCCLTSGILDEFGVGSIDLTGEISDGIRISIDSELHAAESTRGDSQGGAGSDCDGTTRTSGAVSIDICGVQEVTECEGTLSDGVGPYGFGVSCGISLAGFAGIHYKLTFEELDISDGDVLTVYSGTSAEGTPLGSYSVTGDVPTPLISPGSDVYIDFTSSDYNHIADPACPLSAPYANSQCPTSCSDCRAEGGSTCSDTCQRICAHACGAPATAAGFRIKFECVGMGASAWSPAAVADSLDEGIRNPMTTLRRQSVGCFSNELLAVQCCADVDEDCANARITGISLSNKDLRGSIPENIGEAHHFTKPLCLPLRFWSKRF